MKIDPIVNQPVIEAERFSLRPMRRSDLGLLTMYAGDHRNFWPDFGVPVSPADPVGNVRAHSFWLGKHWYSPAAGEERRRDIRPALRAYLGPLNGVMRCPLTHPDFPDVDRPLIRHANFAAHSTYMLYPTGNALSRGLETTQRMRRANFCRSAIVVSRRLA